MSLYNLIHGHNPATSVLLAILAINPESVPRYRDIWWDSEKGKIALHTRTGGGNRDFYEHPDRCRDNFPEYFKGEAEAPKGPWNADLRKIPGYEYDEDDDYDCTYATFYYSLPEKFAHMREALDGHAGTPAGERWQAAISKLQSAPTDDPDVQRMLGALAPMMEKVAEVLTECPAQGGGSNG